MKAQPAEFQNSLMRAYEDNSLKSFTEILPPEPITKDKSKYHWKIDDGKFVVAPPEQVI